MAIIRAALLGLVVLIALAIIIPASRLCRSGGGISRIIIPLTCRAMLRLLRIRVHREGGPDGAAPVLLVANHVSWIDPLVFGAMMPFTMLAKREVGRWPGIASVARLQGAVLVDRSRRMGVPAVNRALADRLVARRSVLFFPEGTTHDGRRRGRFLTSHFASLGLQLALQPRPVAQAAGLSYSDPAAAWIGDATLLPHLWSVLRRPGMVCQVSFGASRPVAAGYDRKRLARLLADDVEALLYRQAANVLSPYESSRESPPGSATVAGSVSSQASPICQSIAG